MINLIKQVHYHAVNLPILFCPGKFLLCMELLFIILHLFLQMVLNTELVDVPYMFACAFVSVQKRL